MEQCKAVVAGPRELDLAGHGGQQKEEEGGEAAQRQGSRATYRPESTWVSGVASGGGGFGSGAHDGERAERPVALHMGGVVSARESAWDTCERGKVPRGKPGGAGGFPGSIWPRTRRGRGPPAAYGGRRAKQRETERGDEDEGLFVISENSRTSR